MSNIFFIIISGLLFIYILKSVKDNKMPIYESFLWVLGSISIIVLSIFPKIIDKIAIKLGINYPPALLFTLCIIFLSMIIFRNSRRIAHLQEKITVLAQEIAILKGNKK